MPTLPDRISGGLIGLLVGDALGVPYEFHPPGEIPSFADIEFDPPSDFRRAHASVRPGTWSDDGAQALCLLASLLHRDAFDADDFAKRLINWHEHGYMAVNGHVFDIGMQTAEAIGRLRAGVAPLEAGGDAEFSQGNGSLMRVLPLALWHKGSDTALVRDAHDQSRLTHGHTTVQACCALYCLWARRMLEGTGDAWSAALVTLRTIYRDHPQYAQALEREILPLVGSNPGGTGFVIDSLLSAKRALEAPTYESVVKTAIAFGYDTDTTACVAGGIAGIRDGLKMIPLRWRESLKGREVLDPLQEGLMQWIAR